MSSDTVITVENLSKSYVIGHQRSKDDGLRHILQDAASWPLRWLRKATSSNGADGNGSSPLPAPRSLLRAPSSEEFWALRDVNLEIKQGEVVGIIGRNGAGKSTLLKILSRITEPTSGQVRIKGRVASLLEVGTGFHPELTGRENIFLNGAILGMTRSEIHKKFDEIVDFAGIERFLDTPVKRYSSGMYVRLAFAVAAHLEPEILIVDEVLAVGDAAFQKKCLGKMSEVAKRQSRTVLFVSHNMAAVENLCRRGIVLHGGTVQCTGTQTEAVTRYLTALAADSKCSLSERKDRTGSGAVRIIAIEMRDVQGNTVDAAASGQDLDICLFFESVDRNARNIVAGVAVRTQMGIPVFLQHNRLAGTDFGRLPPSGAFVCRISQLPLAAGTYQMSVSLLADNGRGEYLDCVEDAAEFIVVDGNYFGSGEVPPASHGVYLVRGEWRIEPEDVDGGLKRSSK